MEEPTELRAPEITLCANSFGFLGNPATQNLCQSCFVASPTSPYSLSSLSLLGAAASPMVVDMPRQAPAELSHPADNRASAVEVKAPARTSSVNWCSSCRKWEEGGFAGFRCRCGDMFCIEHRYSDQHGCSYDYKAAARDAIARDNLVVRAAKIVTF